MEKQTGTPLSERLRHFLPAVILLAAVAAVYWPCLGAGLLNWDDDAYILRNYLLHDFSPRGIAELFSRFYALNYQPVTLLSYMLEHWLVGHEPFLYHAVNVALHAANTLLVLALGKKLLDDGRAAFLCALLFAVHPMHIESVAWISERKDVLYAFFYLAGLLAYLKASERDRFPVMALVFFTLSLLSKSMAISFPLSIAVLDWLKGRKIWKAEKLPFFVIAGIFAWVTMRSQNRADTLSLSHVWTGIQLAGHNALFYPAKVLWPTNLSAFYPLPKYLTPYHFLAPFGAAAAYGAAWYLLGKHRLGKAGIILFLVMIAPVLQLVTIGRTIAADRYVYLPMLGLALPFAALIVSAYDRLSAKHGKALLAAAMAIALLALGIQARARCLVWRDSVSLWSDVLASQPDNVIALTNRGLALKKEGKLAAALSDFNKAIEADPSSSMLYANRSAVLALSGNLAAARADAEEAVRLAPDGIAARMNRGVILFMYGEAKEAAKDFAYVLEKDPGNTEAKRNLEQAARLTAEKAEK